MLVDSHCHLHLIDYDALGLTRDQVLAQASDNQLVEMLCVATTLEQVPELEALTHHDDRIRISTGLHPNEEPGKIPSVEAILNTAKHEKLIAIGETGLDYFRTEGSMDWQKQRFVHHIHAARACQKPLIIHSRDAMKDTFDILKAEQASEVRGILHCFTYDWEAAKKALDLNFMISFSGIVTFKSAKVLQDVAQKIPLDSMLIETDCPYLAPVPHRGKVNHPAYVKHVAEGIAQLRNMSYEQIAEITTKNYHLLFSQT